jgi:hypothetical protein
MPRRPHGRCLLSRLEHDGPREHDDPSGLFPLACWAVLEVGQRVREAAQGKGGRNRDRGTRVLIAISLGGDDRHGQRRNLGSGTPPGPVCC